MTGGMARRVNNLEEKIPKLKGLALSEGLDGLGGAHGAAEIIKKCEEVEVAPIFFTTGDGPAIFCQSNIKGFGQVPRFQSGKHIEMMDQDPGMDLFQNILHRTHMIGMGM